MSWFCNWTVSQTKTLQQTLVPAIMADALAKSCQGCVVYPSGRPKDLSPLQWYAIIFFIYCDPIILSHRQNVMCQEILPKSVLNSSPGISDSPPHHYCLQFSLIQSYRAWFMWEQHLQHPLLPVHPQLSYLMLDQVPVSSEILLTKTPNQVTWIQTLSKHYFVN